MQGQQPTPAKRFPDGIATSIVRCMSCFDVFRALLAPEAMRSSVTFNIALGHAVILRR